MTHDEVAMAVVRLGLDRTTMVSGGSPLGASLTPTFPSTIPRAVPCVPHACSQHTGKAYPVVRSRRSSPSKKPPPTRRSSTSGSSPPVCQYPVHSPVMSLETLFGDRLPLRSPGRDYASSALAVHRTSMFVPRKSSYQLVSRSSCVNSSGTSNTTTPSRVTPGWTSPPSNSS